ncbi:unnamed protein product [Agarophyton chilense]
MHCLQRCGASQRAFSSRFISFIVALLSILICSVSIFVTYRFSFFTTTKLRRAPWKGALTLLARQPFYVDHFTSPPSVGQEASEKAVERLHNLVSKALAVPRGPLRNVWPQKGRTFTNAFADGDYKQVKSLVNEFCEPSLVHLPKHAPYLSPMCLSVFENAYIGPSGAVYEPNTNIIYDMGGGCCINDWVRYTDDAIPLGRSPKRLPIVLAMGFHHSVTYHHVVYELLPRLLHLFPLLDAEPQIYIAIDESSVAERLLSVLGIESGRLLPIKLTESTWIHAAIVLQPPPLFLCRAEWNCVSNSTVVTANVLRDAAMSKEAYEEERKERPYLVLMERARSRRLDGSCHEQRCAKNFGQLRDAIEMEFGDEFEVIVVPPAMSVQQTIKTFGAADVVVGLHGAGFQNIMYCRKGTTVVHIGWRRHYEGLAKEFGLNFHLSLMRSLRRESRNVVVDVKSIVADVKGAINADRSSASAQ